MGELRIGSDSQYESQWKMSILGSENPDSQILELIGSDETDIRSSPLNISTLKTQDFLLKSGL